MNKSPLVVSKDPTFTKVVKIYVLKYMLKSFSVVDYHLWFWTIRPRFESGKDYFVCYLFIFLKKIKFKYFDFLKIFAMTFSDFIKKVEKINRKKYLLDKFWDYHRGLTLNERTYFGISEFENLETICNGEEFLHDLKGNHYCSLAYSGRKINCPYLDLNQDKNNLNACYYHHSPAFNILGNNIIISDDEFKDKILYDILNKNIVAFDLGNSNFSYIGSRKAPKSASLVKSNNYLFVDSDVLDQIMDGNLIYQVNDENSGFVVGEKLSGRTLNSEELAIPKNFGDEYKF